jgi:hypothetical protein
MTEKTLLDEFAMAALTGLSSVPIMVDNHPASFLAETAYIIARCMIKERQKYEEPI